MCVCVCFAIPEVLFTTLFAREERGKERTLRVCSSNLLCCACAALLEFLIDANSRIHPDLTLRKAKSRDLKTMADHFLQQQEQEREQSSGLSRLFLKQLKQPNPVQRRASLMQQSSFMRL